MKLVLTDDLLVCTYDDGTAASHFIWSLISLQDMPKKLKPPFYMGLKIIT